ncbi:MAG: hypothetical protein ACREEM_48420 [Blastocatellia bacterium]
MSSINWEHIQQIFSEAIALPSEARVRYLDEICGSEGPLRAEVEALLRASEEASILSKHLSEAPPPGHLRPDLNIPKSIDRLVLQAMAKHPDQRQQSAEELAHQLTQSYLSATVTFADRVKYGIVRFARWAGWLYFVERERLDDYIRDYKRRVAGNAA